MRYDPLDRRVEKSEYDGHGQVSLYAYESKSYEPLARVDGQGPVQHVLHFHNDLRGPPELLTNEQGRVVWQARHLG